MTLTDSTVTGNTASDSGGGVEVSERRVAPPLTTTPSVTTRRSDDGGGGVASDAESTNAQSPDALGNDRHGEHQPGQRWRCPDLRRRHPQRRRRPSRSSTVSDNTVADEEDGAGISPGSREHPDRLGQHDLGQRAAPRARTSTSTVAVRTWRAPARPTRSPTTPSTATTRPTSGAGVYIYNVDPTFSGGTISGNTAASDGGGRVRRVLAPTPSRGVTISDNTAPSEGGGAYIAAAPTPSPEGPSRTTLRTGRVGASPLRAARTRSPNETIDDNTAGVADYRQRQWRRRLHRRRHEHVQLTTPSNDNDAIWMSGNDGYGGGLDVSGESTVTFTGGSLDSNLAYGGGGFAIFSGTMQRPRQADISSNHVTARERQGSSLLDGGSSPPSPSRPSATTPSPRQHRHHRVRGRRRWDRVRLLQSADADQRHHRRTTPHRCWGVVSSAPPARDASADHSTTFLFDTISGNSAGEGGGNINTDDESTLDIGNSIVANGVSGGVEGDNCTFTDGGTLTSQGYNLIDDSTCGTPRHRRHHRARPPARRAGEQRGPDPDRAAGRRRVPRSGPCPLRSCSRQRRQHRPARDARGAGSDGSCTIGAVEVAQATPPSYNPNGYRLVADEGGIFDFGLNFNGSLANNHLNAPIVGIANSPGSQRLPDGGLRRRGLRPRRGQLLRLARGPVPCPRPSRPSRPRPAEDGYWLAAADGHDLPLRLGAALLPAVQLPRRGQHRGHGLGQHRARGPGWSTSSATSTPRATPSTTAA